MDWLGDLFSSPWLLILICMGILAVLAIMAKSVKARKIGKFCGVMLLFCIWIQIVNAAIMPASGLTPNSSNYDALRSLLSAIPLVYFLWKL